jgi:NADH-quinone oxidoreductase subunit A
MKVLTQFATVFVFLCLGIGFILVSQVVSHLLRPHKLHAEKQAVYECGEDVEGSPWVQFNVRFYLIALFFIIFDVEIIFMLPWAVAFNDMLKTLGAFAFWEMAFFVAILALGLAYVWVKGDLEWVKGLLHRDKEDIRPLSALSSPTSISQEPVEATDHVG